MLKKNVTYNDFDGNPVTEEFYFHMMEADFIDLDFKYEEQGGLRKYLTELIKEIQENENPPKRPMYEFLKELISLSVGKRVGNRFDRSQEVKDRFFQTGAYSKFIIDMLDDPNGIPEFFNAITPDVSEDRKQAAIKELEASGVKIPEDV